MIDCCPCCGGPSSASDFQWIEKDQVLTGRGRTVRFTVREAQVFDVLWKARKELYALSTIEICERAFKNAYGPECELSCVSVARYKVRKKLKPTGLDIQKIGTSALSTGPGCQGTYRLVEIGKPQPKTETIKTRPEPPNIIVNRIRRFKSLET